MTFSPKVWGDALCRLQDEIPDFIFEAWIKPLEAKLSGDRLLLGCPSSFHRDRIRINHVEAIERACAAASGEPGAGVSIELMTMVEFADVEGRRLEAKLRTRRPEIAQQAQVVNGAGNVAAGAHAEGHRARSAPAPASSPLHSVGPGTRRTTPRAPGGEDGLPGHPHLHPVGKSTGRTRKDTAQRPVAHARPQEPRADHAPTFGLDGEPRPRGDEPFSFETFIVGPASALAREATLALARRRQRSLDLVYLAGLSGMGKTHLARAAADETRRQLAPTARAASELRTRVLYLTAEQFTSEFVTAMRNGRNEAWTRRFRGAIELLVVEDIQLLNGRAKTQQELSHTIAHVLDAGGRVLLTGNRTPRDLTGLDERLRAQIGRGFIAELDRPDAIVRRHILRAKAAAGGVHLPADCLDLLVDATGGAERSADATGSVRDIEGLLIQVVTTSSLLGRSIDRALVQEAIDLKRGAGVQLAPRQIEVTEIVRIVAGFFGARPEALASRSRRRDVLVPRQLAMYLANRYTDASLTEIGRALGREHPSVRNAIDRIERQILENAPVRYQIEALCEKVDAALAADSAPID